MRTGGPLSNSRRNGSRSDSSAAASAARLAQFEALAFEKQAAEARVNR